LLQHTGLSRSKEDMRRYNFSRHQ